MSTLDTFRTELRALVGPLAFLHRDRTGRALFVCSIKHSADTDDTVCEKLQTAGYLVSKEKDLWYIDLSSEYRIRWMHSLLPVSLPEEVHLHSLCRSLLSKGKIPFELQPWAFIRQALLLADEGAWKQLYQSLSVELALLKRNNAPLPCSAVFVIANDYAAWKEKSLC